MAEITAIAPDGQGGVTVVDMTAQAIGKLDKELEAHKEPYAKIIIGYLKKRVAESNSLARDVMQEHKSWQRCWKYIYAKASKEPRQGSCAAIEDKVVFEWAEDYYIRDDKAEVEKEKAGQAKQAKKAKTVKPDKKPAEKKQRPKKNGQIEGQMSLADFMGGF